MEKDDGWRSQSRPRTTVIDLLLLSAGSSLRLVTAGAMTYIGCELRVAEYYEKKEEKNWRGDRDF